MYDVGLELVRFDGRKLVFREVSLGGRAERVGEGDLDEVDRGGRGVLEADTDGGAVNEEINLGEQ